MVSSLIFPSSSQDLLTTARQSVLGELPNNVHHLIIQYNIHMPYVIPCCTTTDLDLTLSLTFHSRWRNILDGAWGRSHMNAFLTALSLFSFPTSGHGRWFLSCFRRAFISFIAWPSSNIFFVTERIISPWGFRFCPSETNGQSRVIL